MSETIRGIKPDYASLKRFLEDCAAKHTEPRSVRYFRKGELRLAFDCPPYDGSEKMHLYSLSKAFTSVACGIAIGEGLLSLDERVCDIFPDKMPEAISENLRLMTLRDLLSMQSGHPRCVLDKVIAASRNGGDSLRAFFAEDVVYKPGTKFVYSTAGTMVCGAAVTRRSGESLYCYLKKRLFEPLGIVCPRWDTTPDGLCFGGIGVYLNADDVAKLGLLLLNGGTWNGRRILPEEYVKDASSAHSVDAGNGSRDWTAGYGYQLWINADGGFRGDGAYGQLCIVLPETEEVFVLLGEAPDMQAEVNIIVPFMRAYSTEGGGSADDKHFCEETLNHLHQAPENSETLAETLVFRTGENVFRLHGIRLRGGESGTLLFDLLGDSGTRTLVCGSGGYIGNTGSLTLVGMSPAIKQLHEYGRPEPFNVFAAYAITDGVIRVYLRHTDLPHSEVWTVDTVRGLFTIKTNTGDLPANEVRLYAAGEKERL